MVISTNETCSMPNNIETYHGHLFVSTKNCTCVCPINGALALFESILHNTKGKDAKNMAPDKWEITMLQNESSSWLLGAESWTKRKLTPTNTTSARTTGYNLRSINTSRSMNQQLQKLAPVIAQRESMATSKTDKSMYSTIWDAYLDITLFPVPATSWLGEHWYYLHPWSFPILEPILQYHKTNIDRSCLSN